MLPTASTGRLISGDIVVCFSSFTVLVPERSPGSKRSELQAARLNWSGLCQLGPSAGSVRCAGVRTSDTAKEVFLAPFPRFQSARSVLKPQLVGSTTINFGLAVSGEVAIAGKTPLREFRAAVATETRTATSRHAALGTSLGQLHENRRRNRGSFKASAPDRPRQSISALDGLTKGVDRTEEILGRLSLYLRKRTAGRPCSS